MSRATRARLTKAELHTALVSFAALAAAYADAPDDGIEEDEEADAALRTAVSVVTGFLKKRSDEADARAVASVTATLRGVYARVLANAAGDSSRDGPSSRMTWHEGAWYTEEQRRQVLTRALERWYPTIHASDVIAADLTAADIAARGGAPEAAERVSAHLAKTYPHRPLLAATTTEEPDTGRTVLGVPLTLERAIAFATAALDVKR